DGLSVAATSLRVAEVKVGQDRGRGRSMNGSPCGRQQPIVFRAHRRHRERLSGYEATPPPNPLPEAERGSRSLAPSPSRGGGWGEGFFSSNRRTGQVVSVLHAPFPRHEERAGGGSRTLDPPCGGRPIGRRHALRSSRSSVIVA